jgi:hypothetical protein
MRDVLEWNRKHKAGSPVVVVSESGESFITRTRSAALIARAASVVWVEGERGPVSLERVFPLNARQAGALEEIKQRLSEVNTLLPTRSGIIELDLETEDAVSDLAECMDGARESLKEANLLLTVVTTFPTQAASGGG